MQPPEPQQHQSPEPSLPLALQWWKREWPKVKGAPISLAICVIIASGILTFGLYLWFDNRYGGTLMAKDATIERLKTSLENTTKAVSDMSATPTTLDPNKQKLLDAFRNQFGAFRNYPIATQSDLSQPLISDRIVFIADVPRGPNQDGMLEGKRFVNCGIIGPAILGMDIAVELNQNTFSTQNSAENLLFEVAPGVPKFGMIGMRSCTFLRCAMLHIGIAGDKQSLDQLRKNELLR